VTNIDQTPLGMIYDYTGLFIVASESQRLMMSLWAASTRIYKTKQAFARLGFSAAGKGCGKTTAMQVVGAFCNEPVVVGYSTSAALKGWFDEHPESVVGLDERDQMFGATGRSTGGRAEIVTVLNAGYEVTGKVMCQRSGKTVLMNVYNAMMHGGIGRAPETLADRSVDITLNKAQPAETYVESLYGAELARTGQEVADWLSGHGERKALAAYGHRAHLGADPRHELMMAPLGAVASVAGLTDEFHAADEEIRSGIRANPMPSRAEMLLAAITPLAAGSLVTADEIRVLLPGEFLPGRIGDTLIAGLMRQVGVESVTSNGVRGYRLPEHSDQNTQNTEHRTHT
jgi:hypothetical protein